jgi:hypothetical protein
MLFGTGTHFSDPIAEENIKRYVLDYLEDNKINFFSRKNCEYCKEARDLLESLNIKYNEFMIDDLEEEKVLDALVRYTS